MEKRREARIESLNFGELEKTSILDVSQTGIAIFCPNSKEKGAKIVLEIGALAIDASVVYCQKKDNGFRIGFAFDEIDVESKGELVKYLDNFSRGLPLQCNVEKNQGEEADKNIDPPATT
jgi:hypothetical protein